MVANLVTMLLVVSDCQSDPEPQTISVSELKQILSAFVIVCGYWPR